MRCADRNISWRASRLLCCRRSLNRPSVLGVTQPKVSARRHYKLAGFSVERLMNLLTALDQDVEIVIRRKSAFTQGRPDHSRCGLSLFHGTRGSRVETGTRQADAKLRDRLS